MKESEIGHKISKEIDTGEEREGEMEKIGDIGCDNKEKKRFVETESDRI